MNDADIQSIATATAKATVEEMGAQHRCWASENMQETLTEAAHRLRPDDWVRIAWLSVTIHRVANAVGRTAAKLAAWTLIAALLTGASFLAWFLHRKDMLDKLFSL